MLTKVLEYYLQNLINMTKGNRILSADIIKLVLEYYLIIIKCAEYYLIIIKVLTKGIRILSHHNKCADK